MHSHPDLYCILVVCSAPNPAHPRSPELPSAAPILLPTTVHALQELRAAQKARALINLQEPFHAKALALLFSPSSPFCIATSNIGSSSSGGWVQGIPASLSLQDLCRFFLEYSDSSVWETVCAAWQQAVDAVCSYLAAKEGLPLHPQQQQPCGANGSSNTHAAAAAATTAAGAGGTTHAPHSFDFTSLMCGRVAGLVRKPVRLSFGLQQLLLGLDAGAGLAAARDYCERAAREFAEQAKG